MAIEPLLLQQQQLAARAISPWVGPQRPPPILKLLQVFQFDLTAEGNLAGAIATATRFGYTGLLVKALDGVDWMSTFDTSPDALSGVDAVARQWEQCGEAGLRYFCWTNPRHDVDMAGEALATSRIARACDGVLLDTEPYRQFWGPNAPVGLANGFMESVREQAPDAFLGLQPDPRPTALQEIRVEEWLPFVDVLCGQHYWTDFGSNPRTELQYAAQLGASTGLPVVPTLPGNSAASVFPLDLIAQLPGFILWRLGTIGLDVLAQLGPCDVAGLSSAHLMA